MWWGFGEKGFRVIWLALIPESLNNREVRHDDLHKTPCRHLIPHNGRNWFSPLPMKSLPVLSDILCDSIIKEHTHTDTLIHLFPRSSRPGLRLPICCCGSKSELTLRSDNTLFIITTRDKFDFWLQTHRVVTSVCIAPLFSIAAHWF